MYALSASECESCTRYSQSFAREPATRIQGLLRRTIDGQPPMQVDLTLKFGETRWPTSETNLDPN